MNQFEAEQALFIDNLHLAHKQASEETWKSEPAGINAVFGISHTELPARFLAGFIAPNAIIAESAKIKNAPWELRIFVPLHVAIRCGLEESVAERRKNEGVLIVQKFQETFHPEVQWFLDVDRPLTEEAVRSLIRISEELLETSGASQPAWERVLRSAKKRGNEQTAFIYGPHHVFGWQDAWNPQAFFVPKPRQITINCLSRQEEPFTALRKEALMVLKREDPEVVAPGVHLNLTTTICSRPSYLLARIDGHAEPTLSDALMVGILEVERELSQMTAVSRKFDSALEDLHAIDRHIESLRANNPKLPNFAEFLQEVRHANQ